MRKLSFALLFIGLTVVGCKNKEKAVASTEGNSTSTQQPQDDQAIVIAPYKFPKGTVVGIYRSFCLGDCPTYEMVLLEDMTMLYNGKANVDKIGKFKGKATEEIYNNIISFAQEVGYFDLEDVYSGDIPDLPTTYTKLAYGGRSKAIANQFMAPESLIEFENYLDEAFQDIEWKAVE